VRPVFDTGEGVHDDRVNSYLYGTFLDEQGQAVVERVTEMEEVMSRARRIRYTGHFFPESMSNILLELFLCQSLCSKYFIFC